MCGIAGIFSRHETSGIISLMAAALDHRGPDDRGNVPLVCAEGLPAGTFAHRRLAILDLSAAGHQPMDSLDERYLIVYNGEIYNFLELRAQLEAEGVRLRGGSDTEVLLEGWARSGPSFLERLDGMFAFAIWDRETSRGWLVRDRFGIKPLYYSATPRGVLFASEIRAILASGEVPRRLDRDAIRSYLATGSVAEPLTAVEAVYAVPPGSIVEVSVRDGAIVLSEPQVFATPIDAPRGPPLEDGRSAAAAVREALRRSVARHLVSDVPVALFLSGGIDSSAVVGLASEVSDHPLDTFTVVFPEVEYSESVPARAVARRFKTRHNEIPLSAGDLRQALDGAFAAMDQPSLDGLNTYVVSQAVAANGLKVVLSGLGGDEVFAGYPSFQRASNALPIWSFPQPTRRWASSIASTLPGMRAAKLGVMFGEADAALGAYRASRTLFAPRQVAALAGAPWSDDLPACPPGLSPLQQVSWYEIVGYMRNTLLRDSDVFSMAHGLELRVPFVDREVVIASMAAADQLKLEPGASKPLLVAAVEDLLPREVWDRPKQGFTLPLERWLRRELHAEMSSGLDPQHLARVGLSWDAAQRVWQGFVDGGQGGLTWSRPWAIYTLARWARENGVEVDPSDLDIDGSSPAGGTGWSHDGGHGDDVTGLSPARASERYRALAANASVPRHGGSAGLRAAREERPSGTPNFFIIGAPKTGTTALYEYLASHANIFLPRIKEPHFLAEDFPDYRTVSREDQYLRLFAEAGPQHTAIGEASVFYLYSARAVPNILRLNPAARLIVMLRNPVDLVHALHSQFLYSFREDEKDFERAWRLQDARRNGEHHPRHCMEPSHLQYREVASLGAQVQRLLGLVPREQVLLLFQEDLQSDPREVYLRTLDFLGLPDDGRTGFPVVNQNKTHRVEWIARSLMRPPFPVSMIKGGIKRGLQLHDTRLGRLIYTYNQREEHRASLTPELRVELAAEFQDDIELLESLTGRDLRHWYG